jgi:hypothetical protein
MVDATFTQEGDTGVLTVITHFGTKHDIDCVKKPGEAFRVGGSAINEIAYFEGCLLETPGCDQKTASFRAFKTPTNTFEGTGVLSSEDWPDRHCWVTEYYDLKMEGQNAGWVLSREPIPDANHIFVNVDVLDGGGNIMKRYRVSAFFGDCVVMDHV